METAAVFEESIIYEEFQSLCKVGDEVWVASGEKNKEGGLNGTIWRFSLDLKTFLGKMGHNLEHMNSMSYDSFSDCMLVGELWEGASKVFVFEDVST